MNSKLCALALNKKCILIITGVFFISGLLLPFFYTEFRYRYNLNTYREPAGIILGWKALVWGWYTIFNGGIWWFANIGLYYSIRKYLRDDLSSLKTISFSVFLALSSILYEKFPNDGGGLGGAIDQYIIAHGMGFYFWLVAYLILFFGILIRLRSH